MDRHEIERLTIQLGEGWAYPHVRRVLALGGQIAGDLAYNAEWFWYAAYLHDWGAFPIYRQAGVEHALRSRQVAETEILPPLCLPDLACATILEAVELHDYRDPRPVCSPEALLLREADFLDFLGPLGAVREFAWGPNNLSKVIERIRQRITAIRGRFTLPLAQELAEERTARMEALLEQIERDSGGYL